MNDDAAPLRQVSTEALVADRPAAATPSSADRTEHPSPARLHGLDAVRAFALLGGILLHACLSFLPDFADIGWVIADRSPSLTLSVLFYVIHIFRMTTFFLIAGYFGRMMLHRKGTKTFICDRLLRIGVPLIVGWPLLFPPIAIAFMWAASRSNGDSPPFPATPPDTWLQFPLTHLWFLYFLLWMYGTSLLIRKLFGGIVNGSEVRRQRFDAVFTRLLSGPWCIVLLAVPLSLGLYLFRDWRPWFGIPTPDRSLIPVPVSFLTYGLAFGVGWWGHRLPAVLPAWSRWWPLLLAVAAVSTTGALALIGIKPDFGLAEPGPKLMAYTCCYSVAVWSWTLAVIGMGMRFCSSPNPVLRYLADASYWMYLVHLPLIFFAQALVMTWALHWSIKLPLILGSTLPLMLLSYHFLVRSTLIGGILNGRRYPRGLTASSTGQ